MSDNPTRRLIELEKIRSQRAITVHNERTKLFANALDRASTALLSIGILGPIVTSVRGLGLDMRWDRLIAASVIWIIVAIGLHLVARRSLGGLK